MKTDKKNKTIDNTSTYDIITADDRLGKNRLTVKETLIWLEESKIFFYKIRKSLESKKS
ncbi:MAG: hypothetical protein ACYCSQ_01015 [bacterium]